MGRSAVVVNRNCFIMTSENGEKNDMEFAPRNNFSIWKLTI